MSLAGFVSWWWSCTRELAPQIGSELRLTTAAGSERRAVDRIEDVLDGFRPADSVRRVRQASMILADTVAATGGQEHQ